MGKNKFKIAQMEECCKELTAIAKQGVQNHSDVINAINLIEQKQETYDRRYSDHEHKEDAKNKWIYTKFEENDKDRADIVKSFDKQFSSLSNRLYLLLGGVGVLAFLSRFLDISLTVSQGG